MISINGRPQIAWFEFNVATGETIGVLEDGSHGAIADYVYTKLTANLTAKGKDGLGKFMSALHGFTAGTFLVTSYRLCTVAAASTGEDNCEATLQQHKTDVF